MTLSNSHQIEIRSDGALRVLEGPVDEHSTGYIGDILYPPLFQYILLISTNSDEANVLVIGNNLERIFFGGAHTVVCVIGLN